MAGVPLDKRHQTMTLAFAFSAFESLVDPQSVFADARDWTEHVGVIGNDTEAIQAALAAADLEQDFAVSDDDKWLSLIGVRQATPTERHVFVGTTGDDRRAAEHTGWEFLHLADAAEKAGWELTEPVQRVDGPWQRFRSWFASG